MLQIVHTPTSDNINRFAWHDRVLYIEFKKTREVYMYSDVPEATFDEMCQTKSVGSYFHAAIKKVYEAQKTTTENARALGFEQQITQDA